MIIIDKIISSSSIDSLRSFSGVIFCFFFHQECAERYIEKIIGLLHEWVSDSLLKDISFKAIKAMSNLLLQKTPKASKSQEHQLLLQQLLDLQKNGKFEKLRFESKTTQKLLIRTQKPSKIC